MTRHRHIIKRMLRLSFLAVVALLLLDAFMEGHGLPGRALGRLFDEVAGHGHVRLTCSWLRIGVFRGCVLRNASLKLETPCGPLEVIMSRLRFHLSMKSLLRGRPMPKALVFHLAEGRILDSGGKPLMTAQLERFEVNLDETGAAHVQIHGQCEGVSLESGGVFAHGDQWLERLMSESSGEAGGSYNSAVADTLAQIRNMLRECDFGKNEAKVYLQGEGDLLKPESLIVHGELGVGNAMLKDVLLTRLWSRFKLDKGIFVMDRFLLRLNQQEFCEGSLSVDMTTRRVSAKCNGNVVLASLLRLAGEKPAAYVGRFPLMRPITFSLKLPESALNWQEMAPTLHCQLENFALKGIPVSNLELDAAWKEGHIQLNPIMLDFGGRNGGLKGSLNFEWEPKTLAAKLEGDVDLSRLLETAGFAVPRQLESTGKEHLAFELKPSPLDWYQWRASLRLKKDSLSIAGRKIHDLLIDSKLEDCSVRFGSIAFGLEEEPEDAISLSGGVDLRPLVEQSTLNVDFKGRMLVQNKETGAWIEGLSLTEGHVTYDMAERTLSAGVNGNLLLDKVYSSYWNRLKLPGAEYVSLLRSYDKPEEFTIELPPFVPGRQPWMVAVTAKGDRSAYDELELESVQGEFKFDADGVVMKDIKGTTVDGGQLETNMQIQYAPYRFTMDKTTVTGNPLLVTSFIANTYGKKVYNDIWEGVVFEKPEQCTLSVPSMTYVSGDGGDWNLEMEIDVDAKHLAYHAIAAEQFKAKVNLDLPGRMTVTDVQVFTTGGIASGNCSMTFSGVPQLEFDLAVPKGTVNPKDLLVSIAPEMEKSLMLVSLGDQSMVDCHGSVVFGGTPRMELQGRLDCDELRVQINAAQEEAKLDGDESCVRTIAVQEAKLDWAWNQDVFRWNMVEGKCLGGTLLTTGYFNMGTNTGEAAAAQERE